MDAHEIKSVLVRQLIEECFQQILDTATAIADPFEQALRGLL